MQGEQLTNKAVVIKNEGTYAHVCVLKEDDCEHCTNILCNINKKDDDIIQVKNKMNAQPGDNVIISVEGKLLFKASLVLYGLPLVLLLLSLFAGMKILSGQFKEPLSFALALGVLGVYYSIVYFVKNTNIIQTAKPEIIEIVKN